MCLRLLLFLFFIFTGFSEDQTTRIAKESINVSSSKHIVFCWSNLDHPKDTHSYGPLAERWSKALAKIDNVTTQTVEGFPGKEVWI